MSKWVGDTEGVITSIFSSGREYYKRTGKRPIIFIDEAEALLNKRGSRHSSDVDKTIVPTFLSEMDGFQGYRPLVILSTNLASELDPAITRDGRIDLKIEVDRPNLEDAKEIFTIHFSKVKCETSLDILSEEAVSALAKSSKLPKISGAMIETIVKKSALRAVNQAIKTKSRRGVISEDVIEVIESLEKE